MTNGPNCGIDPGFVPPIEQLRAFWHVDKFAQRRQRIEYIRMQSRGHGPSLVVMDACHASAERKLTRTITCFPRGARWARRIARGVAPVCQECLTGEPRYQRELDHPGSCRARSVEQVASPQRAAR